MWFVILFGGGLLGVVVSSAAIILKKPIDSAEMSRHLERLRQEREEAEIMRAYQTAWRRRVNGVKQHPASRKD